MQHSGNKSTDFSTWKARLREGSSLDRETLGRVLGYGDAFLFVDAVSACEEYTLEARYRVPEDSELLRAHFAGMPVMPGVLTGEGMAQAGALLVRMHLDDDEAKLLLALKIGDAAFSGLARPGDTLTYRVTLEKAGSKMAKLRGVTLIGERQIAQAKMTLAVVAKQELADTLKS